MLSVFPELFTYALVAPFILRITLGGYFLLLGLRRHKEDAFTWNSLWNNKSIGSLPIAPALAKAQIIIGLFLIVGLYTQIATLVALVFIWLEWFKRYRTAKPNFQELWSTIFVTAISLSLLFIGAGFLAFDLPL